MLAREFYPYSGPLNQDKREKNQQIFGFWLCAEGVVEDESNGYINSTWNP